MLEFRALGQAYASITAVTGLTPEQVTAVTAPFLPGEKPKAVFTAQTFDVSLDLSSLMLPPVYLIRCWVWVKGSASSLAPISYDPTPPTFIKSKLWRLLGGESEGGSSVTVALPSALPVCRVAVEIRGLFDETQLYTPPL
jgi:hypothetical protein